MTIVAFAGTKGSGKTTAAEFLVQRGFQLMSLADPLKDMCSVGFGLSNEQLHGSKKETLDPYHDLAPREIMQRLAELVKAEFGQDFFIKALLKRMSDDPRKNYVIADLRFENEATALRAQGAKIVYIDRDVAENCFSKHISETEVKNIRNTADVVILNRGSLPEFQKQVINCAYPSLD